jgi:hypothetical protein
LADELALLAARHNVAIGAAQGMDELLLALAEHNRNVAHLPQVDDDDEDNDHCSDATGVGSACIFFLRTWHYIFAR